MRSISVSVSVSASGSGSGSASAGGDKWRRHVQHEPLQPASLQVCLVHVPKTAGSAIKQTLKKLARTSDAFEGWKLTNRDGLVVHIIAKGHSHASAFPREAFKVEFAGRIDKDARQPMPTAAKEKTAPKQTDRHDNTKPFHNNELEYHGSIRDSQIG